MYNLDRQGSFDCRVWAQQGRGGATGKPTKWSFPLVTVQGDSGFDWKASNRICLNTIQAASQHVKEWCRESEKGWTCRAETPEPVDRRRQRDERKRNNQPDVS
jgi:hypothetical protein